MSQQFDSLQARSTRLVQRPSVLRPSVLAAMVYFGLVSFWFLWILCTAKFPAIGDPEPFRLISTAQYACVSVLNGLFLVAFVVDGLAARGSPPGLRRAHFAGLLVALPILALLQLGVGYAHGPIPKRTPPAALSEPSDRRALLWQVDLSEEAAEHRTREELWEVGVSALDWPSEVEGGVTKEEILDRLLEAKWERVGDFGYGD